MSEAKPMDNDYLALDVAELQEKTAAAVESEASKLHEQVSAKLTIGVIGNVGAGKSSLINAVFGKEVASAHPIAGWSKEVKLIPLPSCPNLVIADTPGLEDVSEVVSQKTVEFQSNCDMFLYVINGAVGCMKTDRAAYATLVETERPVAAVINKADAIRGTPEQMEEFVRVTRTQLGALERPFFVVAADPDPKHYPEAVNVGQVIEWLLEVAKEQGKELILARALKDKQRAADVAIYSATIAAAAAGALPIPGSDYIVLTAIQSGMLLRLSYIFGKEVSKKTAVQFITQVLTSGAGRQLYRLAIQGLKALGWFGGPWGTIAVSTVAAAIAASITYGLGRAWLVYLESDFREPIEKIVEVFEQAYATHRKSGANRPSSPQIAV